jgi:hypothetical protein
MATYIQGVTDYIPEIQPFQPDYNILAQALSTKEAQYQAGYDKISGIYGTLLNSNMTHSENIERRNKYFTQIENEIQKIAGLDLSRQDNVISAQQVFKPLINDKYIHKDMSFTKSFEDSLLASENYKRCVGENCGGQWWETGDLELAYKREEFANASLDQTLGMQNLNYTPFQNAYKMGMDFAKEMNFESQSVEITPDGRYQITRTNGQQMVPDLSQYMMATVGNDPKVADTYKTQAYVDRKNYIKANAQQYGSEEAAERQYFTEVFTAVEESNARRQAELEKQNQQIDNKKKLVEENKKTGINPAYDTDPEALLLGLDTQKEVVSINKKQADDIADLSNPSIVPNLPIDVLRSRVDAITASNSLQETLITAASNYANLTQKVEIKADEYGKMQVQHQYNMAEIAYKAQLDAEKEKKESETMADALGITDGVIVPGDVGQTDPNYNVQEEMIKREESLRGDGTAKTEHLSQVVVSQLQSVANDPNASPERRQEARRLLEDTYGVLETSTTYKEKTYLDEFVEEMKQDWESDDEFTWYNPLDLFDIAKQAADASWDYMFDDEKKESVKVEKEGYLRKDASGNLSLVKDWQNKAKTPFINDMKSANNVLELQGRIKNLITSEDFKQVIKGREDVILPDLYQAYNDIQGTEAELLAVQQAHLNNNKAVLSYIQSTPTDEYDPFIMEAREQFLDDKGNIRSLEEFAQAVMPVVANHPDREVWDWSSAAKGAMTANLIPIVGPVAGVVSGYRSGKVPMGELDQEDMMDEIESIYDEFKEDFSDAYANKDIPGITTEFSPLGGHTGAFSQGVSYQVDSMLGGMAPSNRAAGELLSAINQSGALANPKAAEATWIMGDGSMITPDVIDDQYSEDKENAIRAMMQQMSMDFLSSNPKNTTDGRPRFKITSYGTGAQNRNNVAITFTPSQAYLKGLIGSENLPGVYRSAFGKNMDQATFTLIIPREKLAQHTGSDGRPRETAIISRHTNTRVERVFNLTNQYNIDYGNLGGSSSIRRDSNGNVFLYQTSAEYDPQTGRIINTPLAPVYLKDFDINQTVETLNQTHKEILQDNSINIKRDRR